MKKLFTIYQMINCFLSITPILMAGNTIGQSGKVYAMAALPIISVPIQDVQLFDYAVAHKSVNASYGLQANNDETYIIDKDPYTSDQQRLRDQYEINNTDWNEVTFEQIDGTSKCKLALNNDWVTQNNYSVDAIVNMNLPEQGISGPFKITSIKHIIPQKKPIDEDPNDDYEYRPVTGLFVHQSNDLWNIKFDNGTELGVTNNHPIYSVSKGDWQHAGHLEIGEEVLAKGGNAKVVSKDSDLTLQPVYNLEVKDLHNFLVGDVGVVVHNTCSKAARKQLDDLGVGTNNHRDMDIPKNRDKHLINKPGSDNVAQKFGKDKIEICFDDLGFPDFNDWVPDIPGKGKLEFPVNMFGNNDYGSGDYGQALSQLNSTLGTQFSKLENITLPGYEGVSWTFHHHQDGKTMQLVPSVINANTSHVGGKTIMKNARAKGVDHWLPGPGEIDQYRSLCK
jgi:hypothetical protein